MSERERGEGTFRERNATFSLRYTEIEPWVFVEARVKVDSRNEGYAWVPKSGSFVKLQEVGNFSTLIIFILKAI